MIDKNKMVPFGKYHLSDYAAQNNPGWRVRWGAQYTNMVLLNNLENNDEWLLVWCDEDPNIILNASKRFVVREGVAVHSAVRNTKELADIPSILVEEMHSVNAEPPRSAPRHANETPYLTEKDMENFEKIFYDRFIAPYEATHKIYAVSKSGTALAKRLGVQLTGKINVSHYSDATVQDESMIEVSPVGAKEDDLVLVIDDMVSSGWTAEAVFNMLRRQGCTRVRFAALFNIQASRECINISNDVDTLVDVSNCYWMYGRGMDLMSEESRRTADVFGADKQYGWETEDSLNDLLNFFNQ